MLRTVCHRPTLWEQLLSEEAKVMPPDLAAVDELLDDVRFFEPFRAFFDPTHGRPSIPIETYLRLMFLKYRYRLGFETLCAEVSDSISWFGVLSDPYRRDRSASLHVDEDHNQDHSRQRSKC